MRTVLLATVLLSAAGLAGADELAKDANVGQNSYIGFLPSYELPDSKRGVDPAGGGISLLYGQALTTHFGFEVNGHVSLLTTGRHNGSDFYTEGGTVDGVFNFWDRNDSRLVHPFLLAGVGAVNDSYVANGTTAKNKPSLIFGGGGGLVSRVLYNGIKFRFEGRYLRDELHQGFNDVRLSLGIEMPLGSSVVHHVDLPPPPVVYKEVVREVPHPFIDSDGDGVPDEKDKCPDTPHGFKVDSDGCILPDQIIELRGVTFEFNKTRLSPNAWGVLDNVLKAFTGQRSLRVEIGGHCDSIGSDAYNDKLSQGRAEAVREYLIKAGALPEQITAVGYGKRKPLISPEKNDDDRELNRRVEFKVVGNQ